MKSTNRQSERLSHFEKSLASLVGLNGSSVAIDLRAGTPVEIVPGLMLTLDSAGRMALVEVTRDMEVTVNSEDIIDVAQMVEGDRLGVGDDTFVLLGALGVHLAQRTAEDRRKCIVRALGSSGFDCTDTMSIDSTIIKLPNSKQVKAEPKWVLRGVAGLVVAAAGALGYQQMAQEPAKAELSVAESVQIVDDLEPKVVVEETPASLGTAEQSSNENVASDAPKETAVEQVSQVEVVPAEDPEQTMAAPKRGARPASKKKIPSNVEVPEAMAAKVRERMMEYSLESGFDPEAARQKLKALLKEIPKQSSLAAEIRKTISSIK